MTRHPQTTRPATTLPAPLNRRREQLLAGWKRGAMGGEAARARDGGSGTGQRGGNNNGSRGTTHHPPPGPRATARGVESGWKDNDDDDGDPATRTPPLQHPPATATSLCLWGGQGCYVRTGGKGDRGDERPHHRCELLLAGWVGDHEDAQHPIQPPEPLLVGWIMGASSRRQGTRWDRQRTEGTNGRRGGGGPTPNHQHPQPPPRATARGVETGSNSRRSG